MMERDIVQCFYHYVTDNSLVFSMVVFLHGRRSAKTPP